MKIIRKELSSESRTSAKGDYYKYTYLVGNDENHDEHQATSIQKYSVGEKVRSWFDEEYNTAKLGKLCQKCDKIIKKNDEISHEFCHYPERSTL